MVKLGLALGNLNVEGWARDFSLAQHRLRRSFNEGYFLDVH